MTNSPNEFMSAEGQRSGSTTSRREARARRVTHRTRGHAHGPITRLVNPSDVGQLIKPFVFLDYFDIDPEHKPAIGFHPPSRLEAGSLLLQRASPHAKTSGTE